MSIPYRPLQTDKQPLEGELPAYPPRQETPPPQTCPPPAYPTQPYPPPTDPPPYESKAQPRDYYSITTVVSARPAATSALTAPEVEDHTELTSAALVISIVTLICCGCNLVALLCTIPALCFALTAVTVEGNQQKINASISLILSISAIVCCVLLGIMIVMVVPIAVTMTACLSYYNSQYAETCVGHYSSSAGCYYTGYGCS